MPGRANTWRVSLTPDRTPKVVLGVADEGEAVGYAADNRGGADQQRQHRWRRRALHY